MTDKASRPNIIIFVVDDMGYANIGFNNPGEHVKTPHMDAAAANGTILSRHYTYCWCAPTRSALMTGRLPYHVFEKTNHVAREARSGWLQDASGGEVAPGTSGRVDDTR